VELMTKRKLPLSRFKVIDLTLARAGPTCVRVLADWGADVIRIEQPSATGEEVIGKRDGSDFQNLHRNKRAITLNLKSDEGREVFMRLAREADVIVENMRSNVKFRLGVDYESVRAVNPGIVYASISGFGQDGPYKDRAGVDQIAQGMGGLMSITGLPGQGPVRVGVPISDLCSGAYLAQGVLIALLEREATGEGQWVTTSLLEAQIAMLDFQATRWLVDHEVPKQEGNFHPTSIPTGVFKTADGHVNIAATGQRLWTRLCETLGATELVEHTDYATAKLRSKNRHALHDKIGAYIETRLSAFWVETFSKAGIPCGPINSVDQVFADPQVQHLGLVSHVEHGRLGVLDLVKPPIQLSLHDRSLRSPAPDMGADTDRVLESLGYDDEAIRALRSKQVI
jgi:crotonobetainyl-CoA:carnitine CoA-transferase CaiB-like acyl-CoA transferase